jgi:hypothetical protein
MSRLRQWSRHCPSTLGKAKAKFRKLLYSRKDRVTMMSQLAGMLYVVRDFAIRERGEDYNLYIEVMGAVRMITLHNWPHDANRER